jgi:hypothetical protein
MRQIGRQVRYLEVMKAMTTIVLQIFNFLILCMTNILTFLFYNSRFRNNLIVVGLTTTELLAYSL